MTKFHHQGDVPCYPHKGKVSGEKVKHDGKLTLALGEATGHHHTVYVPKIEDMEAYKTANGGWILKLRTEGIIRHQEHKEIVLPPGTYRVGREREMDWFQKAVRKVVD